MFSGVKTLVTGAVWDWLLRLVLHFYFLVIHGKT